MADQQKPERKTEPKSDVKPAPKEPTGMELEVENAKKDAKVKREAEGAEKEVKRNMSTFGYKKGGYVKAADGVAQRGKTKGRMV